MLSAHVLLIAAIFIPYILLMTGLGYYIWRSGQPRRTEDKHDDLEDGRGASDPGPVQLPAAA